MAYLLLGVFLGLFSTGFYLSVRILRFLTTYLTQHYKISVIALSPSEVLMVILRIDLIMLFLLFLPLILIWTFFYLRPALYKHEKGYLNYIPAVYILSLLGMGFGWLLANNLFIPYFQGFSSLIGVANTWSFNELISFILFSVLCCVLVFQLPLVVLILIKIKVLKLENLAVIRKYVILLAVITGAIITPTPDMITQLIVAVPIYLLFELTIQYHRLTEYFRTKKRKVKRLTK